MSAPLQRPLARPGITPVVGQRVRALVRVGQSPRYLSGIVRDVCQGVVVLREGHKHAPLHSFFLADVLDWQQLDDVIHVDAGELRVQSCAHRVLSYREEEVLQLIAEGWRNRDIAARLGLAPLSVKSHLARIAAVVGIGDRAGLGVHAVAAGHARVQPAPAPQLSSRELDVISGVVEGLSNAEIGRRLHLAEDTVKTHLRRVLIRTGLHTRAGLAARAVVSRWVALPEREVVRCTLDESSCPH